MTTDDSRPNVLCFVMDQLRYDHVSPSGNSLVQTPNIQSLAASGISFERAYVNNPLCMPQRATLFTGRMPRDHGVRTNGIPLGDDVATLPAALSDAGYRTHAIGKLHLGLYTLPLEDIASLLHHGELSLSDFPDRFEPVLTAALEELAESELTLTELPDPEEYPEAAVLWDKGVAGEFPTPYHGLDSVEFTGGHTDGIFGEYKRWLAEARPDAFERLPRDHLDNTPGMTPQAFDWSLPADAHYNRWISDRARAFLRDRSDQADPFFLWCSFPDPHHPYAAPEPWGSMYDPDEVSLPTRRAGELDDLPPFYREVVENSDVELSGLHTNTDLNDDQIREIIATTYGMVSFVDHEIGRVMEALSEEGLDEDALVVFLSDHGDMMGDHWTIRKGPFHFEGLLRIPMIWRWPGTIPEGERTDGLASTVDFAPTVLDYCGVSNPSESDHFFPDDLIYEPPACQGQSLRRQIQGETEAVHDHVIVENDEDYLGLRVRSYITEEYKLTIYPGEEYGELFDLANDPEELHNRWDDPDYATVKNRLTAEVLSDYVLQDGAIPRRMSHIG